MRNILTAGAAALVIGALPLAAPPAQAGDISFMLSPRGEQADLVRFGLGIYAMVKEKDHAKIKQKGKRNGAAIAQNGRGNLGYVRQRGRDHSATLDQQGSGNAFAVIQSGRRGRADVVQRGDGEVGILFQHGW